MLTLIPATLLLALAPAEAPPAAAPANADTATAAESEASSETASMARALFERGLLAYEAGDYAAASTHWSSAYELMSSEPTLVKARRVLAFDLGQAQMRAYDVDGERSRLATARPLLEDYVAWVDRPGHTLSNDEREDRARATEMLARIDILEGAPPPPRALDVPSSPRPATDTASPTPRRRNGTGLIVGGALSLGTSVALAGAAGAFSVQVRRAEDAHARAEARLATNPADPTAAAELERANFDGKQGNMGLVATATLSALMGAGGIAMVATGAWMRRRTRDVAVAPALGPGFAGTTLRVRF
jgi:hypothetical protein